MLYPRPFWYYPNSIVNYQYIPNPIKNEETSSHLEIKKQLLRQITKLAGEGKTIASGKIGIGSSGEQMVNELGQPIKSHDLPNQKGLFIYPKIAFEGANNKVTLILPLINTNFSHNPIYHEDIFKYKITSEQVLNILGQPTSIIYFSNSTKPLFIQYNTEKFKVYFAFEKDNQEQPIIRAVYITQAPLSYPWINLKKS